MLEKVQSDRQAKLEKLRELGVDPFGGRYDHAEPAADILARFDDARAEADGEEPTQRARTAGRLVLLRDMGKMIFATLRDDTGQIQIALRKNAVPETDWAVAKLLDLGDIVGAEGPLARTRTGEITLWADRLTMLTKSLLPMPEKFHGLSDVELRYRQRYLDLMTNPPSLAVFQQRIEIIESIRTTLRGRGYVEVETPMMQPIYGGAAARPFVTHHNTLDCDLYLRISPELYLKRLLVGGMRRVFEINRNFRNEGLSTRHNPEFTMMELYEAYADYNVMMEIAEQLVRTAAEAVGKPALLARRGRRLAEIDQMQADAERARNNKRSGKDLAERQADFEAAQKKIAEAKAEAESSPLFQAAAACEAGGLVLPFGDTLVDFGQPWRRAKYADLLAEHAGVAIDDVDAIRAKARQLHIDEAKLDDAVVTNEVFEATVEEHLVQPTFVIDYPAAICPLTRRDPEDPSIALRFELFIANMELANAYTELNDPAIQAENFAGQLRGEEAETMRVMDEDFVTALQHGMPPAGGMGIGIDRMVMLLTDSTSIRDVLLFPMLRPQGEDSRQLQTASSKPRVFLVDDHVMIRDGIKAIIGRADKYEVIGESGDGLEACECIRKVKPDLVIMNISMPGMNGLDACAELTRKLPNLTILMCTMHSDEEFVARAFENGAMGYVQKGDVPENLILAMDAVLAGHKYLSPSFDQDILKQV